MKKIVKGYSYGNSYWRIKLQFHQLQGYQQLSKLISNQAYMLSTNDIFWISGWIFICLLFIIWLTKPPFLTTGRLK